MDYNGLLWTTMVNYGKIYRLNFFGSITVSSNKEIMKETNLVVPNVNEIKMAFDTIAVSKARVATEGKMNTKTLKKCFIQGTKLTHAKANGLVIGLNACGANPPVTKEKLFFLGGE